MIVKGNKQESTLIRWVQKAAAKDETRPVITGINVADGTITGVDGFRMHAAKTPECLQDTTGIVRGKVPSGNFVAELTEVEGKFPNMDQVMPKGPVQFAIAVNAKYLKEALAGMDPERPTILRFFTPRGAFEVFGHDKAENELYALVMPMHLEHRDLTLGGWRPVKPDAEMLERVKGKIADLEDRIAADALNTANEQGEV